MSQSHPVSASVRQAGRAALAQARPAAQNPWLQWLERFGFLVRGFIYLLIGFLALEVAAGAGGTTASPTGVIALVAGQPYGKFLLFLIALGLIGYSLWGFVRAIFDPLGRGSDAKGLFDRAGFLGSGISYAILLIPTIQALMNKPANGAQGGALGPTGTLLSGPYGKWVIIGWGLFWLMTGIGQLGASYSVHFLRDLKTGQMTADEVRTATWLGKVGYAARGIVFFMIGIIILQPQLAGRSGQPPSFGGALAALAHAPHGEVVLGLVALGLILFGVYSAMCAKWVRIGTRSRA